MKRICLSTVLIISSATFAGAAPTIDGSLDVVEYGDALSIQNTDTGFGNSSSIDLLLANGNEIDQVFGTVSDGRLNVLITGNLATDFTKLVVFADSVDGGLNQIAGSQLPSQFDAFCGRCGGGFPPPKGNAPVGDGALQNMNGLQFDSGFEADYALAFTHGKEGVGSPRTEFYAMTAHYAELNEETSGEVVSAGMILAPQGLPNVLRVAGDDLSDFPFYPSGGNPTDTLIGPALPNLGMAELIDRNYALTHGGCDDDTGAGCIARELEFALDVNPAEAGLPDPAMNNSSNHRNLNNTIGLKMAVNNSNFEGVESFVEEFPNTIGNPQDVTTGVEFSIPLASLGSPSGDIKLTIFVNGTDYDFGSNQFGGTGILAKNVGSDGAGNFVGDQLMVNLASITGNQFVTVANTVVSPNADYNGNGVVDAADYTVWRDTLGSTTNLAADGNGNNQIDAGDYDEWKRTFGQGAGSGASNANVPEPNSLLLCALGAGLMIARRIR